ncbi:Maltose O-acetyltransferase [Lactiplantibacillus plantarum subsp. plantarum]|uniref:Acetyltransferase n=1 Tax=Lactiplantibacillus plantarum subsp. plantarum TaxID=337330 RepID=A0A2S3U9Y7_LACPN|nr:Maltose O-acetyltransferase [Lactiplantibacillus plantarum subsp. plantarum]
MFHKIGAGGYIEPPFHTDYGTNTTIGQHFYANYDAIFVDVNRITIGDNVFMGPRVGLYTAGHPIDAAIRAEELEYAGRLQSVMTFGLAVTWSSIRASRLEVTS